MRDPKACLSNVPSLTTSLHARGAATLQVHARDREEAWCVCRVLGRAALAGQRSVVLIFADVSAFARGMVRGARALLSQHSYHPEPILNPNEPKT